MNIGIVLVEINAFPSKYLFVPTWLIAREMDDNFEMFSCAVPDIQGREERVEFTGGYVSWEAGPWVSKTKELVFTLTVNICSVLLPLSIARDLTVEEWPVSHGIPV